MLHQIELVFNRLKEYHLKIKPEKCHFFDTSDLYLGHILSSGRILANPQKVEKVQDWPIPTNPKEVHSFLGPASYYWRLMPKFAQIIWCLNEWVGPTSTKTKKIRGQKKEKLAASENSIEPREFKWMPEHQQAFDALKGALVTAPVLDYPDFNRKFVLETNASLQGLGAVFSQQDETGRLHVIAFASQSFIHLKVLCASTDQQT